MGSPKTVKLLFDGKEQECLVQTDRNGEIACTARDGRFVKFAKGANFQAAVKRHNKNNAEVPEPPGTQEANAAELEAWLNPKKK